MRTERVFALAAAAGLAAGLTSCAAATSKPTTPAMASAPAQPAPPETAATPAAPKAPRVTSADGTSIAYERAGQGPAILLLHGGGQTRRSWNERGYVERLSKQFTVITMDQRGSGDSDKPKALAAYSLDRVLQDITAVADGAGVPRFHLLAFGHGATVGRHLVARSDRVISAVLVGSNMGPAVGGVFKDAIGGMRRKWLPLLEAHAAGTLDLSKLSPGDRAAWDGGVAVSMLPIIALADYPALEPGEIKVPTLWLVAAEDDTLSENVKAYESKLAGTQVTLKVLGSTNYSDSFVKSEPILTETERFLAKPPS
ncbi:MAG: alpha/beta fold hydrolase [Acidobacteriota bacterium]